MRWCGQDLHPFSHAPSLPGVTSLNSLRTSIPEQKAPPELLLCLPPARPPQKGAGCLIPHAPRKAPGP